MERLKQIILRNKYIKNTIPNNNKRDINSISYLIERNLSQSDCIKLGKAIETVLSDIILNFNSNLFDLKPKFVKKGKRERDHIFINKNTKTIYYAELKSNINLDTEKSKSTILKCKDIYLEIQREYPDYNIYSFLVACRYLYQKDIPKKIKYKYKFLDNCCLIGINEYFNNLIINLKFNKVDYKNFLNEISNAMFNKS